MDNNQQNNNPIRDSLMNMFGKGNSAAATPPAVDPVVPTPSSTPQPPIPAVPPQPEAGQPLTETPPVPAPVETPVVPTPSVPEPTPPPAPEPSPVVPPVETPPFTPTPVPETPQPEAGQPLAETTQSVDGLPTEMQESILDKTLKRVAEVMTDEDLTEFEKVDKEDPSGNAGKYFLMTRVPRFEEILKEELKLAQKEHQTSQSA